jgi:UDP-N-acetylmuramoyl-L-alanyl-D-glutamate--2,6-diaminopimelate ligase
MILHGGSLSLKGINIQEKETKIITFNSHISRKLLLKDICIDTILSMINELKNLLSEIEVKDIRGKHNTAVTGMAYDSRDVKKGFIFFALKGIHTNGHDYIDTAVNNGASVIFHSDTPGTYSDLATYVKVADTRYIMSSVASAFYDHPSKKLKIVGVTGTNGKSTTVSMIYQLLGLEGFKTGFISTVQFDTGTGPVKNHYRQSTPEATEIHKILYEMVINNCTHAVVEATSHGLSKRNNRLGSVQFDGAVFTNITHEHLEFHKTLDRYVDDKANLFRSLVPGKGFGIVNIDDKYSDRFRNSTNAVVFSYSTKVKNADIFAYDIKGTGKGAEFSVSFVNRIFNIGLNLPKIFNVENSLAAILAAIKISSKDIEHFIPHMKKLIPAEGRMVTVNKGQPFSVLVDYAHSPGSFELLFPALREMTKGRLISVFGSAGERDISKRSTQGSIADEYSDIIILTDEDPRGESPIKIIEDIASGCRKKTRDKDLFFIEDRLRAIRYAFKIAEKNDLVVLLGKGHESTIIYKDGPIPWKDKDAAVQILKELGYEKDIL